MTSRTSSPATSRMASPAADPATRLAAIEAALAGVRDPEVDQPITTMGFVAGIGMNDDGVQITLRLPTYFCAPNFTYLMMADARQAVEAVVGPGRVRVRLDGHFESNRLNAGLDGVRDRFRRKTFLVRQERVCRRLEQEGHSLLELTVGDLPPWQECADYLAQRAKLGISCAPDAVFLVAADGTPVPPHRLHTHRRAATVLGLSFASNGALCQSLLVARYVGPRRPEGRARRRRRVCTRMKRASCDWTRCRYLR
jgi:metal-sulfur cluster biosynthetic enzyme